MNAETRIVEVLGRAEQGMTRPFRCRTDSGEVCYVKGNYAGLNSLCCEWIAGNLAQAVGLPVPEFTIAEVPEELVKESAREDIKELGTGLVFASLRLEEAREITWLEARKCGDHEKASILLFDWWVHNEDRCLSPQGGNPNLLMAAAGANPGSPWVFDFNLAFDPDFSKDRFLENHVFAAQLGAWPEGFREEMEPKLAAAHGKIENFIELLPLEWLYLEGDPSFPPQLDLDTVRKTLARPFVSPECFWNLL